VTPPDAPDIQEMIKPACQTLVGFSADRTFCGCFIPVRPANSGRLWKALSISASEKKRGMEPATKTKFPHFAMSTGQSRQPKQR